MNGDHFGGIGDESVGKLGEMDKPVLLDAYIDKCAEVGDVSYDAGQFHAFAQVAVGSPTVGVIYFSISIRVRNDLSAIS